MTNAATTAIPEGYREDTQGRLVPEGSIKPIDIERDRLVRELHKKALELHAALTAFRRLAFNDIEAFVALSVEQYGTTWGGRKGNISLLTFDGRLKVVIQRQEYISFDERLQAAKVLIDECLREWTADASPEIHAIINDAFRVDRDGNIRTAQVLALRRLNITDERWQRAMQAIGDAVQVTGSKSYIRVYERQDDSGKYASVVLDIAGV